MPSPQELEAKFWKALEADRTMMLGLVGIEDGHTRPMTGQTEGATGPIWFFTTKDNSIVEALPQSDRAIATFASKGHDLFAAVHGTLSIDNDRATIDGLWNPHVAAWYEGGRDDPKIALLRLDCEEAEIWENGSSLAAGIKSLFGMDPKKSQESKTATVTLD